MLSQNFVRCKFLDVFLVLSPFLRTSAISRVLFNVLREKQAWEPQQAQSAEEKEGLKRPRGLCAEISISFSVRIMASFGLNWQLQEPSCPNHGGIRTSCLTGSWLARGKRAPLAKINMQVCQSIYFIIYENLLLQNSTNL